MRLIGVGLTAVTLAACSTQPPAPATSASASGSADTCTASPYLYLIGEDATALERVLILRQVRVNWPGDRLEGASKPERLNFNIGASGRIESITCG